MYNNEIELEDNFGWTTRNELQFLEGLWAGVLDCPIGAGRINQLTALKGYAQHVHSRARWGNVSREVVLRWLRAHGLDGFISEGNRLR